jgi:hypothetical protein
MKKYALIKEAKIIKFRNTPDGDVLIITKLLAHNYLPVEEQNTPSYDSITQILTDSYVIQEDKVLRQWVIEERPFSEAQQNKKNTIEQKAIDDIKEVFGDVGQETKVNVILATKDSEIVKVESAKSNTDLRAIITEAK